MAEDATKKGFFDSRIQKGKEFLEADQLKKFTEETKKVVNKTIETVKRVDVKDLTERGKKTISKGKEFVQNFDVKKTADEVKQIGKDFQEDPDKAVDATIEKFIGFVARAAGMPDPKTGQGGKKKEDQTKSAKTPEAEKSTENTEPTPSTEEDPLRVKPPVAVPSDPGATPIAGEEIEPSVNS